MSGRGSGCVCVVQCWFKEGIIYKSSALRQGKCCIVCHNKYMIVCVPSFNQNCPSVPYEKSVYLCGSNTLCGEQRQLCCWNNNQHFAVHTVSNKKTILGTLFGIPGYSSKNKINKLTQWWPSIWYSQGTKWFIICMICVIL